ncbi:MAG: hypothetical protein ABIA78_00915 [archaeon]
MEEVYSIEAHYRNLKGLIQMAILLEGNDFNCIENPVASKIIITNDDREVYDSYLSMINFQNPVSEGLSNILKEIKSLKDNRGFGVFGKRLSIAR